MTDDVPVIWEQNFEFISLQAYLTLGPLAKVPITNIHNTNKVVGIHSLCHKGVPSTGIKVCCWTVSLSTPYVVLAFIVSS